MWKWWYQKTTRRPSIVENQEKTNRWYGLVQPKIPAQFRVISSFSFCMRLFRILSKNRQNPSFSCSWCRKTDFFREVDTESKTCFDVTFTDFLKIIHVVPEHFALISWNFLFYHCSNQIFDFTRKREKSFNLFKVIYVFIMMVRKKSTSPTSLRFEVGFQLTLLTTLKRNSKRTKRSK